MNNGYFISVRKPGTKFVATKRHPGIMLEGDESNTDSSPGVYPHDLQHIYTRSFIESYFTPPRLSCDALLPGSAGGRNRQTLKWRGGEASENVIKQSQELRNSSLFVRSKSSETSSCKCSPHEQAYVKYFNSQARRNLLDRQDSKVLNHTQQSYRRMLCIADDLKKLKEK